MNRSAKLWGPDALEWKPERWMGELPESVLSARLPGIYSNLYVPFFTPIAMFLTNSGYCRMTFGAGKHSCPGFKFSQLEMSKSPRQSLSEGPAFIFSCICELLIGGLSLAEAVLCDLISAFRFSPSPKHSKVTFAMSTIVYPMVDGKPSLPLILEAV